MFERQCGLTGEEQEMRSMSGCAQVTEGNHSGPTRFFTCIFSFPRQLIIQEVTNPPLPALKEGTYIS